jgi:hypothetical protein
MIKIETNIIKKIKPITVLTNVILKMIFKIKAFFYTKIVEDILVIIKAILQQKQILLSTTRLSIKKPKKPKQTKSRRPYTTVKLAQYDASNIFLQSRKGIYHVLTTPRHKKLDT